METAVVTYAGFWKRFVAMIIDSCILSLVDFFIFLPVLGLFGLGVFAGAESEEPISIVAIILAAVSAYLFAILLMAVAGWLYYALMESSSRQATLGKMALAIKVTDLAGARISFGKATGRYFGKIVSGLICMVGYIMAAFTERKQALHDIMAGCLVVNR